MTEEPVDCLPVASSATTPTTSSSSAIIRGDLPPGAPVRDQELAARLGLSRTPVREALARLVDEGLVETKPNAYTRVAPLDDGPAREAAVVVQALQGLAARLAVPRLTDADLDEARVWNARFAAALDAGEVAIALEADDAFHLVFVRAAGNQALGAALARLAARARAPRDSPLRSVARAPVHRGTRRARWPRRPAAMRTRRRAWPKTTGPRSSNSSTRRPPTAAEPGPPTRSPGASRVAR